MKYMRPRFDELEISFMLEILKEVEANVNRQIGSLEEEQEYVRMSVYALRHRFIYEDPYGAYKRFKLEKERLKQLEYGWLPLRKRESVILSRLIARLEKILQHKRGRIPSTSLDFLYSSYLHEIVQNCSKKHTKER